MISIAYVIDSIVGPSAGTEGQLLMLLNGLDRRRFRPVLICLRASDWLKLQTFDFPVEIIDLDSMLHPNLLGAILRFRGLHKKYRFDIVQTFFVDANIFGTLAARCAGIQYVVSSRRNIGYWQAGYHRWILRVLRHFTSCYLANSRAASDVAINTEGIDRRRMRIIYNGLDLGRFASHDDGRRTRQRQKWGVGDDEILVGVVANLRPVKNIPLLIDAVAALTAEFPRLSAVVIGEGDERPALEAQVDRLGLTRRVRLPGPMEDVAAVLPAFDVAVLCSISESFSNALVEYMVAGLPVVASNVGGNAEAISQGESGVLFELRDPRGLVDALRAVLSDRDWAARLGCAARAAACSRYSRDVYVREHQHVYDELVSARMSR